jgi:hypothetical protein
MKNNEQTTEIKGTWSLAQEMQQTFVDWVKKLPFVRRDFQKDPEREGPEEKPADQASALRPTEGTFAGRSPDNKRRQRWVSGHPVCAAKPFHERRFMSEDRQEHSAESLPEIRIVGLNADKTRKAVGSDTVYHVYFELSAHPPSEWTTIFAREWKSLNLTQEACTDGAFLVIHCQLHEVATTQLPALKKAVAATNEVYKLYAQKEAAALEHRKDVWKQERKDVDAMAKSLRFE